MLNFEFLEGFVTSFSKMEMEMKQKIVNYFQEKASY